MRSQVVADSQSANVIGNPTLPRRWPSIETTLDQCHLFTGLWYMLKGPEM